MSMILIREYMIDEYRWNSISLIDFDNGCDVLF